MTAAVNPRLHSLLGSVTLNLADEGQRALEAASGLTGAAAVALLALEEFLGDAPVGRLADVLGLSHSGAVRLVDLLEHEGLAARRTGSDRRRVEVRLTATGCRRAAQARSARDELLAQATSGLSESEATSLEDLLARLVEARVSDRFARRTEGRTMPWWCRTCDLEACGRPEGRCPAQATAARVAGR